MSDPVEPADPTESANATHFDDLHCQLQALKVEHRDLDVAIHHLLESPPANELMLRRLKKRKLYLKDRITQIEAMQEPDIPA